MPSLYSDLNVQRNSNPDGYSANLTAWQTSFASAALAGQLPNDARVILQTNNDFLDALASPEYGRPSGLGAIIDDSVRTGKMIDMNDFLVSERSIYHHSWLPSPWAVLQWSLRQIGLSSGGTYDVSGGRLKAGKLVLVQALEEISNQIIAQQAKQGQTLTDRIMTREDFLHKFLQPFNPLQGSSTWPPKDVEVVLRHLSRDKCILSYTNNTVKFRSSSATSPEPVTPEDASIAKLKTLLQTLQSQVNSLQIRISTLQTTASSAIKSPAPNKQIALSALRSKKLAELTLSARLNTLNQVEEVYTQIENASDQVAIISAMRDSATVLRTLNAQAGGAEHVDKVMEDLRDQIGVTEEVGEVLREPLDASTAASVDVEVDEELEAMEAEERRAREEKEEAERKAKEEKEAEETKRRLATLDSTSQEEEKVEETREQLSHVGLEGTT